MGLAQKSKAKLDPCDKEDDKEMCLQMQNDFDMCYMAEINVGTPPQPIKALFDTGSSNTWILNKKVKPDLPGYDDTKSSTV